MQGLLPEPVRLRPKTGVNQDLVQNALVHENGHAIVDSPLDKLDSRIDQAEYKKELESYASGETRDIFTILGPLLLQQWLHRQSMLR